MTVFGVSAAPAPARAGRWRALAARAITALGATFLLVELFAISAEGLLGAGAILWGAPPWFVAAVTIAVAILSLWLFIAVFARVWDIEARIDGGLPYDDVPWSIRPHFQ